MGERQTAYNPKRYVRWLEDRVAGSLLGEAERIVRRSVQETGKEEYRRTKRDEKRRRIVQEIRASIEAHRRKEALGDE